MIEADDLVIVSVDNRKDSAWKAYALEAFESYGLTKDLESLGRLRYFRTDKFEKYRGGFESVKGLVCRLRNTELVWTSFATMKEEAAEAYVQDRLDRMQEMMPPDKAAKLTRKGGRFTISTPAFSRSFGGSDASSPAWQQHFGFKKGVFIGTAGADASQAQLIDTFPYDALSEVLSGAGGKMQFLLYRPGTVPEGSRFELLKQTRTVANARLQRSDVESDADYSVRRKKGEAALKLLESTLFDVDSITAWTQWPGGREDPFRARIRIEAKPKTRFSKLLSELGSVRSGRGVTFSKNAVVKAHAHIKVPEEFQTLISAVLSQTQLGVTDLPERLIGTAGQLVATAEINLGQHSVPWGKLDVKQAMSEIEIQLVNELLRDNFRAQLQGHDFGEVVIRLEKGEESDWTRFLVSQPGFAASKSSTGEQVNIAPGVLATFEMDLAPLLKSEKKSVAGSILTGLETSFIRQFIRPRTPRDTLTNAPIRRFESLLSKADPTRDWTVVAKLRSSRNALTVDLTVGQALHEFLFVRGQVVQERN